MRIVSVLALAGGILAGTMIDPAAWPMFSGERLSAVSTTGGQVYVGRLSNDGSAVVLKDVYYLQRRASDATGFGVGLVRLADDIHRPQDEIRIAQRYVVAIEPVDASSAIMRAVRMQRTLIGGER